MIVFVWLAISLCMAKRQFTQFLAIFKEFPQRQKVGSFNLDRVLESLQQSADN